jgi:hypothetical protein
MKFAIIFLPSAFLKHIFLPMLPTFYTDPVEKPERKGLRPQSCKAKGRRLQQWCATEFKKTFPHLQGNDVRSLSMGANGDDLILSPLALQALPYNFEMKNVENFQVWATIEQTMRRSLLQDQGTATHPCIVVKRNHIQPVVLVPLGHVLHLLNVPADPLLTLETVGVSTLTSIFVPWTVGPLVTFDKSVMNFWKIWDEQAPNTLLLFNRNRANHIIFAAMPFHCFTALIKAHFDQNNK